MRGPAGSQHNAAIAILPANPIRQQVRGQDRGALWPQTMHCFALLRMGCNLIHQGLIMLTRSLNLIEDLFLSIRLLFSKIEADIGANCRW